MKKWMSVLYSRACLYSRKLDETTYGPMVLFIQITVFFPLQKSQQRIQAQRYHNQLLSFYFRGSQNGKIASLGKGWICCLYR